VGRGCFQEYPYGLCTIKKDKIVLVVPPFSSSVPPPPTPFFLEQPLLKINYFKLIDHNNKIIIYVSLHFRVIRKWHKTKIYMKRVDKKVD